MRIEITRLGRIATQDHDLHELGLTQQLVEIAVTHAAKAQATRVLAIDLVIGPLSGVDADAISFCFEVVSRDTLAQGAALRIQHEPVEIACRECGWRGPAGATDGAADPATRPGTAWLHELELRCRACQATRIEVVAGRSFMVRSLEVE